jgi:type II secretory pathway component PulK
MKQRKQKKLQSSQSTIERSGAVMVAALICLTLTIVLLGTLLKTATTQRKQTRWETYRLQTDWLAESAIERAAQRLSEDAEYSGETWNIATENLGGRHSATIQIEVETSNDNSSVRTVIVAAKYPADGTQHAKRTKRVQIELRRKQ